jgi:hypothetical protein
VNAVAVTPALNGGDGFFGTPQVLDRLTVTPTRPFNLSARHRRAECPDQLDSVSKRAMEIVRFLFTALQTGDSAPMKVRPCVS